MLIVSAGAENEVSCRGTESHSVLKSRHPRNTQRRDANYVIVCVISSTGFMVQCIAHEFK